MDATLALNAIKGILAACDDKTKQRVLKELSMPEKVSMKTKRRSLITHMQAREDLIKNHFERQWVKNRKKTK